MKITKELLEKYVRGNCTEAERLAIENWSPNEWDQTDRLEPQELANEKDRVWNNVVTHQNTARPIIGIYKNIIRFTAAACIVFGAFLTGRLTASDSSNAEIKGKRLTDLLHVYGVNQSYAKIEGEKYNVLFDGSMKLYNASDKPKSIVVGETEYVIEPFKSYFLSGSHEDPNLTDYQIAENPRRYPLKGNFSIGVIKE